MGAADQSLQLYLVLRANTRRMAFSIFVNVLHQDSVNKEDVSLIA
jgi:hypothetical protein